MSKTEDQAAPVDQLSFEQALAELETIVSQLESGEVALEKSIGIYERGEALRARCDELLKQAEARVEKVSRDGKSTEPLDVE
ncbi:MAG: exodeoxyribonuclease VII small subunit [Fimbriimonadaceae bacterium]|nr:exodeoxyribonuclease VII small subunit [Alphaproteobacteria bacterium]